MRLCFLGDVRSVHVQKFVKYFSEKHETHLISFDYVDDSRVKPGLEFFADINTHVYLLKKSQLPLTPFIAKYLVNTIKPDLVQSHFVLNYGFLGAFSGAHPLVVSAMGDDVLIHPFQNKVYRNLVMYALKSADFITCDGVNSTLQIRDFGIPKEKIALIYPGIDMTLFNPSKRVLTNEQVVFYPRGFDKIYDTDTLFEAMRIIHEKRPDVKFMLLGIGTEFERFRNDVLKTDLWKSVHYLGHIPNYELPEYLASADVSVTTALSDGGIPVSTIEALACGVPVVSTDAGDAKFWVRDGESGYVVDKKNPEMIADRVLTILSDSEMRMKFGKRARQIVEKSQDYTLEMKRIEDLYLKLINNHIS